MAHPPNIPQAPAEATEQPATRRSPTRRIARYAGYTLGGLLSLVLLVVVLALLVVQTNWGAEKVKNIAVNRLNVLFDGASLEVDRLGGNIIGNLALYDVNLIKTDGEPLAHVDTLTASYRLLPLLKNRLKLRDIYLASPHLWMEQQADSSWDLFNVIATDSAAVDTAKSTQTALVIELDHLTLRNGQAQAAFYTGTRDSIMYLEDLGIELGDMVFGDTLTVRIDTVFARIRTPGTTEGPLHLALGGALDEGQLTLSGLRLQSPHSDVVGHGLLALPAEANNQGRDLDFTLQAHPLAFQDLHLFAPALDPAGTMEIDMRVKGSLNQIKADVQATLSDGAYLTLTAEATPPGEGPAYYRATGEIRGLDPSFFTGNAAQSGQINADLDVDLQGPASEQVDGHAHLTVFETRYGTYMLNQTTLESTFTDGLGTIDLQTGLRGMALTVNGTLRPFDAEPQYDLNGRLADLDIGRFAEGGTQHSHITATFSLQGQGINPQTADLTARLDLAPSHINAYHIQDGRLTAHLRGGDLAFDTRVLLPEGLIAAAGDLTFGKEMRYQIRQGQLRNLDVAALSGDTTRSTLNGTFNLAGRGTAPEAMTLTARLNLRDSYYGPYRLDAADIRADLQNSRLALTGDADLGDAGRLTLAAAVRPFDAVLAFNVSTARFEHLDIGALVQNPAQRSDLNGTLALSGRGTDPATMTLDVRLALAASQLNEQAIDEALLTTTLRRGTFAFDAGLTLPAGQVALAGHAQPFAEIPAYAIQTGTFNGLNVGALTGNAGLQTDLNGSLTLDGLGLEPATMTLDAGLQFDHSTINDAVMQEGQVQAAIQAGRATLGVDMDLADGTVIINGTGIFTGDEPAYEAHGTVQQLNLAALSSTDSVAAPLSFGFELEGEGTNPATMTLQGTLHAQETAYGDVQLDTLSARFHMDGGLVAIDSLLLRSNIADARAEGQIALFDTTGTHQSDFRLDADITSLAPVRGMINAEVFSLRNGTLHATVQGPAHQLRVEAATELNSLVYNQIKLAGLEAQLEATLGPDFTPASGDLRTDLNYLSAAALTVRQTHFESAYNGDEATFLIETNVDPRRDARFVGRIDLRPERQNILIEDLGMRFDEDRWALDQPATIAYGDGYRFSDLTLRSGSQHIVVDGIIDPDGTQDFHLLIEQLRVGGFADLLGFEALGGSLTTQFDLTGPAAAPLLDGALTLDLLYRERPHGAVTLDLAYAEERLNLDALLTHVEGSTLAMNGYLPFQLALVPADSVSVARTPAEGAAVETAAAQGAADLRITSEGFAIAWARPFLREETVDALQGRLRTDIHVGGQMDAPELDGTFSLADGRVGLPDLGVTYQDIQVDGTLQDNVVVLQSATVHSGDGALTAEGRIEMPQLSLGAYDLRVQLDDFRPIDSELYRATTSGTLAVSGTTDAPVISGEVQVHDTDIYLTSTTGGDIRQVELTEDDARMLEEFFGYRVSESDTRISDVYAALALNMNVELERDTWVRQTANPEMAIELTGRLDIQKQPGDDLNIFRSIEVIPQRSYIRQFGKRFDLNHGTITFNGPVTELIMDIEARHDVRSRSHPGEPEATIILTLSGRLDDLAFTLGSEPTMDNTDVVSYLATGKPAGEALQFGSGDEGGDNGGLLTAGGGLAANQLAGIVEGIAGEELGLDVIEIEQDGLRGTQLVAGKYVSPQVYVGINQPIALSGGITTPSGSTTTEVTVEYEMFEWLLLQMLSGTSTSSVRLNLMGKHSF